MVCLSIFVQRICRRDNTGIKSPKQGWCSVGQNTVGTLLLVFSEKIICESLDFIFYDPYA